MFQPVESSIVLTYDYTAEIYHFKKDIRIDD